MVTCRAVDSPPLPLRLAAALDRLRRSAWKVAAYRAARAVMLPLIVALPPLFWILDGTRRASLTTLGRDQGIFQYIAWAIQNGAVDYRDVRDVNGPLTHLVHMAFLAFGGADEHRFRVLDLAVTGVTFAFVGACLPGLIRKAKVPLVERAAWALASWVVLSGQHLMYLYWDLAQRETFFDWFVLTSLGIQLVARRRGAAFAVAGALSVLPWFGKPTFALFTFAQVLTLLVDDGLGITRRRALAWFAAGGASGATAMLGFLVARGDVAAFLRIYLVDVPQMYRFMMPRTPAEILSLEWGGGTSAMAVATSLAVIGLVVDRQMPRRVLAIALFPVLGIVSVLAQGKGFPYHFHPVTVGLHLSWLLIVVWLWERFRFAERGRFPRVLPYAVGAALAVKIAVAMGSSPHITDIWILGKADDAAAREGHDYLVYFRGTDWFPWELRQTAAYLREHTKPTDRVQIYGMDPYVLFLARRMSATPYIYAYDLDADAALDGSWMPAGLHPDMAEAARIHALRDAHEADFRTRLEKEPPAAFVFFDRSPLISYGNSWQDFELHCPETAAWVHEHYRETAAFADDHVWMRNDLAETIATESPETD